jgi:XTP/dITP diphosphohydrolase
MRRFAARQADNRIYGRDYYLVATLASRNEHKARELERVLPGWTIELLADGEFPPEEAESYYENALEKARFGRRHVGPGRAVLGEDSGIESYALGGLPGVRSARWSHQGDNVNRLLRELEGVEDRRARYVCELVCVLPEGEELRGTGTLEGTVATERRGSEGFGYDPIFVPLGETRTVAELGDAWKAQNSHRARAARALLAVIRSAALQ